MPEPITTAGTAIKAGAMLSSGGIMANLVIFTDGAYPYLSLVGAIVSMFGVLHEIFGEHTKEYNASEILAEILKGLALGVLAIPFWYLALTEGGGTIIEKLSGVEIGKVSNSLALIISFALSWYTVPLFNWMSNKVKVKANDD